MEGYWECNHGEKKRNKDFIEGIIAGVTALAVWKDGKQFVGCGMTPLKEEIKQIKKQLGWEETND